MALSEIMALKFSDHIRNEFDEVTRDEQKVKDEVSATGFIVQMQPNFSMFIAGLWEIGKAPHGPMFFNREHQYRLSTCSILYKCKGCNYSKFVSLLFDPGGVHIFGKSKCIAGYDYEIVGPRLQDKMTMKFGATLLSDMSKRFVSVLDNHSFKVPNVVKNNDLDRARKQALLVNKNGCMRRDHIDIASGLKLISEIFRAPEVIYEGAGDGHSNKMCEGEHVECVREHLMLSSNVIDNDEDKSEEAAKTDHCRLIITHLGFDLDCSCPVIHHDADKLQHKQIMLPAGSIVLTFEFEQAPMNDSQMELPQSHDDCYTN